MKRLTRRRYVISLAAIATIAAASLVFALELGPSAAGLFDSLRDARAARVVFELRGPRVILAALVGASLAAAGVAFQALLRNPLADPFILGVSGGAAVGAAASFVWRGAVAAALGGAAWSLTPVFAFAGALAATGFVYALSRDGEGVATGRLLLTGVVVNAFLSALILLFAHLGPPGRRLLILGWMTGNLGAVEVGALELATLGALAAAGLGVFVALARDLDLLSLGDRSAAALGVDVRRARFFLFFAGSLVTGAAVSWSGLIGFVGLIVPHTLRLVLGPDHRLLVPAAFLGGAAFLALADGAARSVVPPEELPVGVLTALAGAPFFLFLLASRRRRPEMAA